MRCVIVRTPRYFAIREIETDAFAGVVQLLDIHPIHRSADLRIRIGNEKFRNRGFGTEALRLVLAFAWGDLNLERVQLGVFASNQRAIAAYKKAGFHIEGEMRHACFIGNRWENSF